MSQITLIVAERSDPLDSRASTALATAVITGGATTLKSEERLTLTVSQSERYT